MIDKVLVSEKLGLTPYQAAELKKILNTEISFIDNSIFADRKEAKALFNHDVKEINSDWYIPAINKSSAKAKYGFSTKKIPDLQSFTLSKEDEQNLFLRYNYSRSKLIALKTSGIDTKVKALRAIVWSRRVNKYKEQLVAYNLALVLSLCKKFSGSNLDSSDLLSEGNLILINAIDSFDARKDFKFSTYLTWSVERAFGKVSKKKSKNKNFFPVSLDVSLEDSDPVDNKHEEQYGNSLSVLREIIDKNEAHLSKIELAVINTRYPRDEARGAKRPTLDEVGKKLNKNKSSMSRIEKIAIEKLQNAFKKYMK